MIAINLETTRLRCRPRNRCLDEVREDGITVGGERWQEKVCNRGTYFNKLRCQMRADGHVNARNMSRIVM